MQTGKEDISIVLDDPAKSGESFVTGKALVFAHEFSESDDRLVLDLTNLVAPSEFSGNGFSNPSVAELAGAQIYVNRSRLKLFSSSKGWIGDFSDFIVADGLKIIAAGNIKAAGGFEVGEQITGYIESPTKIVSVEGRNLRRTVLVPAGQTTLNTGFTYRVGKGLTEGSQIGAIKIGKDGKYLLRNVGNATASPSADGNFQEIDSGNNYGTTVELNNAPAIPTVYLVELEGIQPSSESTAEVFSQLEKIQGQLQAIGTEVALELYGEGDGSRYFIQSPSEVERLTFGNILLSIWNKAISKVREELVDYTGFISRNASNYVKLRDKAVDSLSSLVSEDNTGDHTRYTFLEKCNFVAHATQNGAGQNNTVTILLFDSNDVQKRASAGDVNLTGSANATLLTEAEVGDYLVMFVNPALTPADSINTHFSVKATKVEQIKVKDL